MMKPKGRISSCLVFSSLLLMAGCSATLLQPTSLTPELIHLNQVNSRPLLLDIEHFSGQDLLAGHQYLLVILPFGRIYLRNPEQQLQHTLLRELGLDGYKILADTSRKNIPKLTVRFRSIRLSAYDLLVTRRIVAKATIELEYLRPAWTEALKTELSCQQGSFVRFAFYQQLSQALDSCLAELANGVAKQIR